METTKSILWIFALMVAYIICGYFGILIVSTISPRATNDAGNLMPYNTICKQDHPEPVPNYPFTLSDSALWVALNTFNVGYPEIVFAQAILETGNFTSRLCIEDNNLFGLYNSNKKQFYKLDHWIESIIMYKNKVQYKHCPGEDYYVFLERIGYAEDPNYIKKLKIIVENLEFNKVFFNFGLLPTN